MAPHLVRAQSAYKILRYTHTHTHTHKGWGWGVPGAKGGFLSVPSLHISTTEADELHKADPPPPTRALCP